MRRGPLKCFLVTGAAAVVLILQIIAVHLMLRRVGLATPVGITLMLTTLAIVPYLILGVILWSAVLAFRGQGRSYVRGVFSAGFIGLSLMLMADKVMLTYFYAVLKNSVPLLTLRNYDQLLWDMDRWLLFGLSPNVFLLNLFSAEWFLRAIDFGYGNFFFISITAAYPFFFAHPRDSLRASFLASSVMLWSSGAWLYYAVPSIGPAYTFFGVWDEVKAFFPVSTYWQSKLLENYRKVMQIREGIIDPDIDMVMGVAAFPSLHVAFHMNLALWLNRVSRFWGRVGFFMVGVVFVGSVLTGWHYMIDSVAGVILGAAAYGASQPILRWLSKDEEPLEGPGGEASASAKIDTEWPEPSGEVREE